MADPPVRQGGRAILWARAAPIAAGVALRLWNLRDQPLLDDEVAAVRAVLRHEPGELLWSVVGQDFFRPMAALARLWIESGGSLAEAHLRLPSLVAGIAALFVLPRLVRADLGAATATVWAWLLAVSPLLVFYSRLARSYMPAALAATAALVLLVRVLARPSRREAVMAGACGIVAIWFHPVAAPVVVGGFAAAVIRALLVPPRRSAALGALAFGTGAAAASAAALLAPGLPALLGQLERKSAIAVIDAPVVLDALRYLAGTASVWWALVAALVAAAGVAVAAFRRANAAAVLASASVAQLVAVLAIAPYGADHAFVLARYLLFALPSLQLLAAIGSSAAIERFSGRAPAAVFGAALAAVALATGPLPELLAGGSSLAHHGARLRFLEPPRQPTFDPPEPLRSACSGRDAVVAWVVPRYGSRSFDTLERLDRRLDCRFVLVDLGFVAAHEAIRFRNAYAPTDLARSGARLLVLHLPDFPAARAREQRPGLAPRRSGAPRAAAERRLVAMFGEPDHRDARFRIWRLPIPSD